MVLKNKYLFACEKCGAKLKFSIKEGELKCPYCSHINIIQRAFSNIVENDYYKTIKNLKNFSDKPPKTKNVKCKSCAAIFEMNDNIHSSVCPYCNSPIVNETELYKPIKPQGLLPFKVTQKDAKEIFKKWLDGLWFAPNKLKEYGTDNSKLEGVFIPYWTYDAQTYSNYSGRRGDKYYVNEQVFVRRNGRSELVTKRVEKIRWSSVSGDLNKPFDDVLVMASKSLKHHLPNWDLQNLVNYDESYLSGFESEIYSIELDNGFEIAKYKMDRYIGNDIKVQIGGDIQEIDRLNTQYDQITYKHILLPIYASAFEFKGKIYSYVINGRNGEISGDRPYSYLKIAFSVIVIATVISVLYYFFGDRYYY
jgi:DNA-directed RNA polymerase subunit RPC12/RpoP